MGQAAPGPRPRARAGPTTTHLTNQFYVEGTVRGKLGDVMYDDGFVVYLNGYEVGRA